MNDRPKDLHVRQHQRIQCNLVAEVRVAPGCAQKVTISRSSEGGEAVKCALVDFSAGGLGLLCPVFLPKMCELVVRVMAAGAEEAEGEEREAWRGESEDEGKFVEALVRVQRATMIDRRPTYYLGCCFSGEGRGGAETAKLMAMVRGEAGGEGGRRIA